MKYLLSFLGWGIFLASVLLVGKIIHHEKTHTTVDIVECSSGFTTGWANHAYIANGSVVWRTCEWSIGCEYTVRKMLPGETCSTKSKEVKK